MAGAVHDGGFIQLVGNGGLDIGAGDHQVPHGYQVHQDHDHSCIQQFQVPDVDEDRDQAAAEQHGEGDGQADDLPPGKFPGKGIGSRQRDDDAQRGADNRVEDGVQVAVPQLSMPEDGFIAHCGEVHRPKQHLSPAYRVRIGNGGDDDQPQGIQHDEQHNDPEDQVDGIEYPVFPGFLDARFPAREYDIRHFAFPLFRPGIRTG